MSDTEVILTQVKLCDFCKIRGIQSPAEYDFKTRGGPWANACEKHYDQHKAYPTLGLGKGQKLIYKSQGGK
jgi:hypothetical protein